jgi:hypothetical protein
MPLETVLGQNNLSLGNAVAFGTCMLGSTFGVVKSASLKRTADRELIKGCNGNLRAVLLSNARFELSLKTAWDLAITAPGLMDAITLPLLALTARVLDVTGEWVENGERMLTIEASHWDSLVGATVYTYNGTIYTAVP